MLDAICEQNSKKGNLPCCLVDGPSDRNEAQPKSIILMRGTSEPVSTRMLSSLMSLWNTPLEWISMKASNNCLAMICGREKETSRLNEMVRLDTQTE